MNILFRLNRGVKTALHRWPLLVAFLTLVMSATTYRCVLFFHKLLDHPWHFISLHGLAIALATFWLFLGLSLNGHYFETLQRQKRPSLRSLLRQVKGSIRPAITFSTLFIVGVLLLWLALFAKHLLLQLPYLGTLFSILFAWLPFVLFLLLKLLPFVVAAFLFLTVPLVTSEHLSLNAACVRAVHLWQARSVETFLCTLMGLMPLVLAAWLVSSLDRHTMLYLGEDSTWILMLRQLILAVSSAAVMSPAISLLAAWGLESLQWLEGLSRDSSAQ